jgi:hypothetical protein
MSGNLIDQTPFGEFDVICKECGSRNVNLENSIGWSAESSGWGSIDLYCMDCNNRIELMQN